MGAASFFNSGAFSDSSLLFFFFLNRSIDSAFDFDLLRAVFLVFRFSNTSFSAHSESKICAFCGDEEITANVFDFCRFRRCDLVSIGETDFARFAENITFAFVVFDSFAL